MAARTEPAPATPQPRPATAESVRAEAGDIPAIEGLRGMAVLWVLLFHYFVLREGKFDDAYVAAVKTWQPVEAFVRNGYLGVDLFFLITGFLLTLPWFLHAAEGRPAPETRGFYARRARRILPAYYVHLVLLFFVALPLLFPRLWIQSPAFITGNLGAHATFLHYATPLTSSSMTVNGALWTLAIEFQYYLLLPFVAPLFVKWPWRCLLACLIIAGGWRWLAAHHLDFIVAWYMKLGERAGVTQADARHLLATQLPAWSLHFALGILAGRAWLRRRGAIPRGMTALAPVAAIATCTGLLFAVLSGGTSSLGQHGWAAYPLLIAGMFAAIVAWPSPLLSRMMAVKPLTMLGRVSYSAYLYHLPMLLLFNAFVPGAGAAFAFILWLVAVLVAAGLSYRFVEAPYLQGGRPRKVGDRAH